MEVILGGLTFTGSLMAAGKLQEVLPAAADHIQGTEPRQLPCCSPSRLAVAVYLVLHPDAQDLFPFIVAICAGLRCAADHSDRRRGHADGDLAVEFLRRACPLRRWDLC